jgi:uncharacterized membrane protein (UPF0127 family)
VKFIEEFELADTTLKRIRGLMFRRSIKKPLLFILPAESRELAAIHSFFVFFPFDAVFLDSKRVVVDVRSEIKPFTSNITPNKPAKYLIEMKAGEAKKRGINVGSKLPKNAYI